MSESYYAAARVLNNETHCQPLIPYVKAAMADGFLSRKEIHNLNKLGAELNTKSDYAHGRNMALQALGRPLKPYAECTDGSVIFALEDN